MGGSCRIGRAYVERHRRTDGGPSVPAAAGLPLGGEDTHDLGHRDGQQRPVDAEQLGAREHREDDRQRVWRTARRYTSGWRRWFSIC